MSDAGQTKNLHKDHRKRLRKKILESDGEILESHELLEALLFAVYAQKNTNTIARELIKRFGTIYKVFEASKEELLAVPGVGEECAAAIKLQAIFLRRYNADKLNAPNNMRMTPKNAGAYITNFFQGYGYEMLIAFALDSECRIITSSIVSRGTIDKVQAYVRDIVKMAVESRAVYIIIAHNHPNGTLEASESDVKFTLELEKALAFINIRLIDHVIVAGTDYMSLANQFKVFELMP